jgi:hypothetical protein
MDMYVLSDGSYSSSTTTTPTSKASEYDVLASMKQQSPDIVFFTPTRAPRTPATSPQPSTWPFHRRPIQQRVQQAPSTPIRTASRRLVKIQSRTWSIYSHPRTPENTQLEQLAPPIELQPSANRAVICIADIEADIICKRVD